MEKIRGATRVEVVRWMGFLAENLERGFLTTRGLLRPWRGGICSPKISSMKREKKRGVVQD
jgi:hypothetical protein